MKRAQSDSPTSQAPVAPQARRPYEAPRVDEEKVFEREALLASCYNPGQCGSFFKNPS